MQQKKMELNWKNGLDRSLHTKLGRIIFVYSSPLKKKKKEYHLPGKKKISRKKTD